MQARHKKRNEGSVPHLSIAADNRRISETQPKAKGEREREHTSRNEEGKVGHCDRQSKYVDNQQVSGSGGKLISLARVRVVTERESGPRNRRTRIMSLVAYV